MLIAKGVISTGDRGDNFSAFDASRYTSANQNVARKKVLANEIVCGSGCIAVPSMMRPPYYECGGKIKVFVVTQRYRSKK